MKNLTQYSDSSKILYNTAVDRKEIEAVKNRLTAVEAAISDQYDLYDQHFENDTLVSLMPNAVFTPVENDLRSLYEYNAKTIRELKEAIEMQQPAAIRYTCQTCTLTANESFDHYLPQGEFPEYSIHTTNLIPCCKTCNGYKSHIWHANGKRLFLNPYFDTLPNLQYLFVEVLEEPNNEINFRFYLENLTNIPEEMYNRIETHFKRLRLQERMRKSSIAVISELQNTLKASSERWSLAGSIDTIISTAERNKTTYGINYWKSILEISLVQSDVFLRPFFP